MLITRPPVDASSTAPLLTAHVFKDVPSREAAATGELLSLASACNYDSQQLASHLGVSQRQLQRLFKAQLKRTPHGWLREQRLLAARRMLESSRSVKQVAYALGFTQDSQFCRDYKRTFGHSPSADLRRGSRAPLLFSDASELAKAG
jgi:transcriptional regulator GlxA family with amidase domain